LDLSGQREHQPKSTNLNQVIELAWTKCNQEIHFDHNLKLVRGLDPNLPEVLVDQQQVEQALFTY
jgi:nitrogen-specific signal transduction histidine kinase